IRFPACVYENKQSDEPRRVKQKNPQELIYSRRLPLGYELLRGGIENHGTDVLIDLVVFGVEQCCCAAQHEDQSKLSNLLQTKSISARWIEEAPATLTADVQSHQS